LVLQASAWSCPIRAISRRRWAGSRPSGAAPRWPSASSFAANWAATLGPSLEERQEAPEDVEAQLEQLSRLHKYTPVNSAEAREQIVPAVLESPGYPLLY